MTRPYLSSGLREQIARDFEHRCSYCLAPQRCLNVILEVDHIRPLGQGGETSRANLCLACPACNSRKSDSTHALDPDTNRRASLYNPRTQRWTRHFAVDGIEIRGRTAIGRATVVLLQLNHPLQLSARALWRLLGLYPPPEL